MLPESYAKDWQFNRIKFMVGLYGEDFFKGKSILELGPFNGLIGNYFHELGAKLKLVEGRQSNIDTIINRYYPHLDAVQGNLDTDEWKYGKYDIIINFGLNYHLEKYHKEHLVNCIRNCDFMFFETVVFDSYDSEIYFRSESGNDQSLTGKGGNPSTSFIEDIFKEENCKFTKYTDPRLNGTRHEYDWPDINSKILRGCRRRFWTVDMINDSTVNEDFVDQNFVNQYPFKPHPKWVDRFSK